jgi:hypothetical protein
LLFRCPVLATKVQLELQGEKKEEEKNTDGPEKQVNKDNQLQ